MGEQICHVQSLRTAFTPAHIQLCCDGVYLALPVTRTTVGVWSLQDIVCKPLELEGHSKILTSLCLGHGYDPKLLVSAADDYVILWNLVQARQQLERGGKIRGKVIGTTLGRIQYTSFSPNNSLVAVCTGFYIVILLTQRESVVATLEGHNGNVTCAEFCPHYRSTLVSISEDRTYKVWNLEDFSLVYQSPIITASPFLSLAMCQQHPHTAIGTADGLLRIFDLTDGNGFRCLHQVDISKAIGKEKEAKRSQQMESGKVSGPITVSSRPSWKQQEQITPDTGDAVDDVETGATILGLHFMYQPTLERQTSTVSSTPSFLRNNNSVVKDLLKSSPMILVGTTAGLVQLNAKTMEFCNFIDFQDAISSNSGLEEQMKTLNAAGSVIFGQGRTPNQMWCILGSPFQNIVHVLQWTVSTGKTGIQPSKSGAPSRLRRTASHGTCPDIGSLNLGEASTPGTPGKLRSSSVGDHLDLASSLERMNTLTPGSGGSITVLSTDPLLDDSPLRSEFVVKEEKEKEKKPKGFISSPQKGKVQDNQPLTFKSKIKSSGYSAAPRMSMFKPKTSFSASKLGERRGSKTSVASSEQLLTKEYPMKSSAPSHCNKTVLVAERETAINCIGISGTRNFLGDRASQNCVWYDGCGRSEIKYEQNPDEDGSNLACALANKSALVFSLPLANKGGTSYIGHNHIVNHVNWSHSGSRLLTSSDDRSAALWVKGQSDPVLKFKGVERSVSEDGSKNFLNPSFSREVRCGRFYYVDKFIFLVSTNNMYLYKYKIDLSKNDVQRYLSRSKYKLVQQWSVDAQQITALSAINSFHSYIVFCALSNKCVEVYDMNVGKRIRLMTDAHSRSVHNICQNEGSPYVSHPPNAYDLYATAAAGDCIKLWDLRTNRCVRRYEGHLNRVHPCGIALSPCGRFIATGAEDKSAYIFDIRSGTYIHKLTGQTDVIADVAFHPLNPQLYTASLDGKIQVYANR